MAALRPQRIPSSSSRITAPTLYAFLTCRSRGSCQRPVDGAIIDRQPELTDASTPLGFKVDSRNPEALQATGPEAGQWRSAYFNHHTVSIRGKGQHVFDIRAVALHHACRFWIRVEVLDDDGKKVIQTFGDGGQPFRVSAML